jgi:hypothetical protein
MFIDLFSRSPGSTQRSAKPEVRNPLLGLPSAARAADMPREAREWLLIFLQDIRFDAQKKAQKSWASHKAPQALYWKIVAVYAGHIAKVLRKTGTATVADCPP